MTGARSAPRLGRSGRAMRHDLQVIAGMIAPDSRVLDIGCGDGALLDHLVHDKGIDARGIELSQAGVNACVTHGLSVVQGDADTDLADYPDGAFDFAVLSQTLQATRAPRELLLQLVRIASGAIVSFTNFGQMRIRWRLGMFGRMPAIGDDGTHWFDTPNIHLCTIRDFVELCAELDLEVERAVSLSRLGRARNLSRFSSFANLQSEQGIFLLRRKAG
jgi:methionine biosynthesis protein MetW